MTVKRIAVLTCLDACKVCTGAGCLKAWNRREHGFAPYAGEADNRDIQRFAYHLSQDHPARAEGAAVFMGHGTEHFANAVYPALQTALHFGGRNDIYIGTVEGWPGLEEILRQLEPGGTRRIDLLPLMLAAGGMC